MSRKNSASQTFWRFLFVAYCGVMLWLLFGRSYNWVQGMTYPEMLRNNANFKLLHTIRSYWSVVLYSKNQSLFINSVINLAGNVLLFIPAGYLFPKVFSKQRNYFFFLFSCFAIILLVEIIQLVSLLGSFDVDDILLNLSGMTVGFLIYTVRAASRKGKRKRK